MIGGFRSYIHVVIDGLHQGVVNWTICCWDYCSEELGGIWGCAL